MSAPWKRPEGWSPLACEIAWYDWHSRLDYDNGCGVGFVLSVTEWSSLDEIRDRLDGLGIASLWQTREALRQVGAVEADEADRKLLRAGGHSDDVWGWPDAETAKRAWRAVGALKDPAPEARLREFALKLLRASEIVLRDPNVTKWLRSIDMLESAARDVQAELDRLDLLDAEALR